MKKLCSLVLCSLTAISLAMGCKPKGFSQHNSSNGYFKTQFQTECQFIVEAIVSDLAEQMYFAGKHRLPDPDYFSVIATEKAGSPVDAPIYELQIGLDEQHPALKVELNVNGPIWSPEVYDDVGRILAGASGASVSAARQPAGTDLLTDLLDGTAETIERNNHTLSYSLEQNFSDPQLHEQAALLLGAFLLRDHSGNFFEIKSPLSRMAAHLAMARYLNGGDAFGLNGQIAKAMMLTLVGDQAPALDQLTAIDSKDPAVAAISRALQTRNTGDFQLLTKSAARSQVESVAWFGAMADYCSAPRAWQGLDDSQKATIDFVRAAYDSSFSVEMGNQLSQESLALELQEIQSVYQLSRGEKLEPANLVKALNEPPDHAFVAGPGNKPHVRVIGWGQWANFLQRHLCQSLTRNFYMMNSMWGMPDDAKKFAQQCDQQYDGLLLYPFVRRFDCSDEKGYHDSVDDGFKVTVASPHLVPAQCWNYLCYQVRFAPLYKPNPNPHISEWHNHNPPPGTVYDLNPRLNHRSLISRGDVAARFGELHQLAPYDVRIANNVVKYQFGGRPSYEQAEGLFHDELPWSVNALQAVANTVRDKPEKYEKLMLQAARLDPSIYYYLSDYASDRGDEDEAAQYVDKACDTDPDVVRASNRAEWRVRYYLKKGKTAKAGEIAETAAQVYSSRGLLAKAVFLEATSNYDGAFEWFAKNEERYNYSGPLIAFCERYKAATGDTKFDPEIKKRLNILFPKGVEKVSMASFQGAPADGAVVLAENETVLAAGMKKGDVIVALNGVRTHSMGQYVYVRDSKDSPELDLIVWGGDGYHNVKASPPNRRFGVNFDDYTAK